MLLSPTQGQRGIILRNPQTRSVLLLRLVPWVSEALGWHYGCSCSCCLSVHHTWLPGGSPGWAHSLHLLSQEKKVSCLVWRDNGSLLGQESSSAPALFYHQCLIMNCALGLPAFQKFVSPEFRFLLIFFLRNLGLQTVSHWLLVSQMDLFLCSASLLSLVCSPTSRTMFFRCAGLNHLASPKPF